MSKSDIDKFIDFLKSFEGGSHKGRNFHDTIREISRKESGKREPLINCETLMYSLDDIAKGSDALKGNLPKTTDALFYRKDDGKLLLYLIEFKFHNLDDPDAKEILKELAKELRFGDKNYNCLTEDQKNNLYKVKKYYGDSVNHALILKPIESVTVVIPKLYEEYCQKRPEIDVIDIEKFLEKVEKRYFVFVSTYSTEDEFNPENERMISQGTRLERHFERLKYGNIINHYEIKPRCDFEDFLKIEQLINVE